MTVKKAEGCISAGVRDALKGGAKLKKIIRHRDCEASPSQYQSIKAGSGKLISRDRESGVASAAAADQAGGGASRHLIIKGVSARPL